MKNTHKVVGLGVDIGYSGLKFAVYLENNKVETHFLPNDIAEMKTVDVIGSNSDMFEMNNNKTMIDTPLYKGKRYYVGEATKFVDDTEIINIVSHTQIQTYAPVFLYTIFTYLEQQYNNFNINKIEYIAIGISLAHIKYAKDFQKEISKFTVNGIKYDFSNKLLIIPQAVGANYAIKRSYKENNKAMPQTYLIVDIGRNTVDILDVINGIIRLENVIGLEEYGDRKVLSLVENEFKDKYPEIADVITKPILRSIMNKKDFIKIGNKEYDISFVADIKRKYTSNLLMQLKDKYKKKFMLYEAIFFVGGGAYSLNQDIMQDNIIIADNPEFSNAIGNAIRGYEVTVLKNNK